MVTNRALELAVRVITSLAFICVWGFLFVFSPVVALVLWATQSYPPSELYWMAQMPGLIVVLGVEELFDRDWDPETSRVANGVMWIVTIFYYAAVSFLLGLATGRPGLPGAQ